MRRLHAGRPAGSRTSLPCGPDDSLEAYRWLLARGYKGPDIVVAGDSAGGNLCLGLLPRLRDAGLPLPACALALSPLTDATFGGASIQRNDGVDPMFTARGFRRLAPLYLPDLAARAGPLASPLAADLDLTAHLDAALLQRPVAADAQAAEPACMREIQHAWPVSRSSGR